jgi:hypothetical protein
MADAPSWQQDGESVKIGEGDKWWISLTGNRLAMKKSGELTEVNLDDATLVAYSSTSTLHAGTSPTKTFSFIVKDSQSRIIFATVPHFRNNLVEEAAWSGLVSISQRLIEPRLLPKVLEEIVSGASVGFGPQFVLSKNGFAVEEQGWTGKRQIHFPWSALDHVAIANGAVQVYAWHPSKKKPRMVASVILARGNAVLLPRLMPICKETFG